MRLVAWAFAICLLIAHSVIGGTRRAGYATPEAPVPILVELFTSEGCSTCPPADAMLERMDTQPIHGTQLIVLSEHVDYWNHDGWKDPYSSSSATARQNDYLRVLGLKTAYTPQMIVDGTNELQSGNPQQISQVFQKALSAEKISIRITSLNVEAKSPAAVRGQVEVDGTSEKHNGDVYVAVALDRAESQVLRGENSGKHLTHVAVVQELKLISKFEKGKNIAKDFELKLKPGTDPANLRIIAFVQESGPGRVMGAALRKIEK